MKKYKINNITLDNKHSELIEKFKNDELIIIPKYKNEIIKLENMLNKINNKIENLKNQKKNILKKDSDKKDNILSNINNYKNKIYLLEKEKSEYFLNNSKYIFSYFEEKKNIENSDFSNNNELLIENNNKNINNNNTNNTNKNKINKFFNIDENAVIENSIVSNSIIKENKNSEKYFYNVNNKFLNYENYCFEHDICIYCKKGEMIYVESEGLTICNNCSKTMKYLIENEKPSYKEPPKEVCFYAYKRINHLREILAQFQAKESTYIPLDVFENIKNQIKKERIDLKDLSNKKTKEILKNLGYNKYYEHIPYIKDKLGIKPPVMSPELEETLCNLFMEIQKPYAKYCPSDRVNFLNYYYTLYKLCELLGETKFLQYFPMLKDREKRIEQDQIWKKICEELGWKFIPTL